MNMLIFGPPSAGKGTQSELIKEKYNLSHISTGDIFRYHIKNETELGKKVKSIISAGQLVPDELTCELVADAISKVDKNGFLLDGFPRNIFQAEALDDILSKNNMKVDIVININVDEQKLIERIVGRRICKECGASYHIIFNPSDVDGKCDKCGAELYQREDDTEEVYRDRLNIYKNQTLPMIEYYEAKDLVKNIDGNNKPEIVFEDIVKFVGNSL